MSWKQFRSTHPFVAVGTKRNSYEGEIDTLEKRKGEIMGNICPVY